ncbi:MAG: penicillin-binding protein 1C [Proteobacteria bacterium]|nr:penicillin-binding protein 1C [Pseudomonadota bacterium]
MTRKFRRAQKVLTYLSLRKSKRNKKIGLFILGVGLAGYFLIPKPVLLDKISFSRTVYSQEGKLLRLTLSDDEKYRLYEPIVAISENLIEASLLYEDKYFFYHPGVNPLSLLKAFYKTYISKGRRVGASTITMQLARMLYHIDSRTIGGKLEQILRAFQLELHYSKENILEAYLNLVPYGGNIEGVGAASLIYFNKSASRLNLPEAITLSVIPQSPKILFPEKNETESGALKNARWALVKKWIKKHPNTTSEEEILTKMPIVTTSRREMPFLAPHLVNSLLSKYRYKDKVYTTLDLKLQRIIEKKLKNYVERRREIGITNASAMLIDYRSMAVKTVVGSANFFNDEIEGQVNGTRSKRSPGSTLKPFVYALALEQGIIHPMTMLKDSPYSFAAYDPENYDQDFEGPIKAIDALNRSRNLPAVFLTRKIKNPDLYDLIKEAGVTNLKSKDFYGLAIVLGGIELTMEELIKLYAMLANGGLHKELVFLKDEKNLARKLLNKDVSFLTIKMLEKNKRPGHRYRNEWISGDLPVAWKTGTSFAFRDGWAIGIFDHYVLAVWIGNFDGRGNPVFIGRTGAGPLFFEIIDAIKFEKNIKKSYQNEMEGIKEVEVCSVSGNLPNEHCSHKIKTLFIPGKSPIDRCDIHREIAIDKKTRLRSCSEANIEKKVYEFWPSDLLNIFRLAGIPRRVPPPYDPKCSIESKAAFGNPPEITSPITNVVYNLRANKVGKETIPFTVVTDADTREVFWFVDEKLVGRSTGREPFFWHAIPGKFIIRVVDDNGRSDREEVEVSVVE